MISERLYESISRLEAWVRNYGAEKSPEFIRDLESVIEASKGNHSHIINNVCNCHERDGSHVCAFGLRQGVRGHMDSVS